MWVLRRVRRGACCAAFCLAGYLLFPTAHAETKLKLAHVASDPHPIGLAAARFARHLAEISEGELVVDVFSRSAMGGVRDIWVQMQTGSLDMQTIDVGALVSVREAQPLSVLATPFLFKSQQHMRDYLASPAFSEKIRSVTDATGIRLVGLVGDRSPRIIQTTKKKIAGVDDMQGLKMRIPGDPMFAEVFRHWKSIPTPTKSSEIRMALKSGLVDGQDNGILGIDGSGGIKYVAPINWLRAGIGLFFSEARWEKLSSQQQDWIAEAVSRAGKEGAAEYESMMEQAWNRLDSLGIEVTEPDMAGFKAVTDHIVQKFEGDWWPTGWVSQIRDFR